MTFSVQTFLPYPDFAATARVLDPRRLGKQRVEALQVFRSLVVPGYGWRHHPAVKMWAGCEEALVRYGLEMCAAWTALGHADTVAATLRDQHAATLLNQPAAALVNEPAAAGAIARERRREPRTQAELMVAGAVPAWLGRDDVHRSHRSALVRKDPGYYGPLFPDADPEEPYVWPAA
jgi:hypothetical protein